MTCVEDLLLTLEYDDNWERQFYMPGDTLRGVATLHLKSPMRVRTLTLYVFGNGVVSWEIPSRKKIYSDREEYLKGSQLLLDAGFERSVVLGVGSHEFSFTYKLPEDIPSSFTGVYGSVTYIVKAVLEGEDERDTTITSEPFLILRRPPLSPSEYSDKKMKKSKRFLGLCTMGSVDIDVALNQTAGVPGRNIYVNAEVRNWSPREINLIQGSLICQSIYYCRKRKKKVVFRQIINKRVDNFEFHNRHGRRWRNVIVALPPFIPETNLEFSNIIDVTYHFQFRVEIDGSIDLQVETPVQVGGYPEGMGPVRSDVASVARYSMATREWPWYAGRHTLTESVDGDAFDLR